MSAHTVAYCGIEGSFASIAAEAILPDYRRVSYTSFKEAYQAVENGECEMTVLPIENSYAGEVGQVNDLLFAGKLFINGVYELKVSQCLLAVPGSRIEDIKMVMSHQQALDQCAEFISAHKMSVMACNNTAVAAKTAADKNDKTVGAIGSKKNAELYGLEILAESINESETNVTKFAVCSKDNMVISAGEHDDFSSFILMFTVENGAGTLVKALEVLGKYGYSMRVIRSRPTKNENWAYYFYTEVEGKISSENGEKMLKELDEVCTSLKVLGSYYPGLSI
ncbi:MAG: bifunctional chorismate mutase/prephenate dehydratase [Lachnospiraceae bacterium]|nr:bifunctional chorismate mutase/prephenate dehydratase [Lachnospiraceae bacterium]